MPITKASRAKKTPSEREEAITKRILGRLRQRTRRIVLETPDRKRAKEEISKAHQRASRNIARVSRVATRMELEELNQRTGKKPQRLGPITSTKEAEQIITNAKDFARKHTMPAFEYLDFLDSMLDIVRKQPGDKSKNMRIYGVFFAEKQRVKKGIKLQDFYDKVIGKLTTAANPQEYDAALVEAQKVVDLAHELGREDVVREITKLVEALENNPQFRAKS